MLVKTKQIGQDMTPEEMQDFQDKLRQDFGHTIRVRVEKPLTPEEREALINHIRYTRNDFNASIEIIEPIPIDFDFEVLPSQANFVFARPTQGNASEIAQDLREQGIIVRYFNQPRINDYLRITIGTAEQNQRLIEALKQRASA